jgi:nitroimidazol reductase NimA-like FMN-containing flavoprotein (pyridoxamine 5'-phosphate oxidase superfamily)
VNSVNTDLGPLEVLDRSTCLELLGTVEVGHLAWAETDGHVQVLPLNFALDGDDVVVRTGSGTLVTAVQAGRRLSFQADDLEPAVRGGWTVLITGTAHVVGPGSEADRLGRLVQPWAGGLKPVVVRLQADDVTGRRLTLRQGGVDIVRPHEDDGIRTADHADRDPTQRSENHGA